MYNTNTSRSNVDSTKYSVADILTSMANGEAITPSFGGALPVFSTSVPTGTTPVLTPSTIVSIEQTLLRESSDGAVDFSRQSGGFVPPLVNPIPTMVKQEYEYTDDSSQDPDWSPAPKRSKHVINIEPQVSTTTPKVKATPGRKRKGNHSLPPEEEHRRDMRRERNKVAAAKCRQRRVDLTNTLQDEAEGLEDEQAKLENDIQSLQQQKEQLEFLLKAHKPVCNVKKLKDGASLAKSEHSRPKSVPMGRPTSLPIPARMRGLAEEIGVPVTTPSSGIFATLGLDSMVDGHTGLTPITGAPSCANQVQKNSNSDSSSEGMASPTLMAL